MRKMVLIVGLAMCGGVVSCGTAEHPEIYTSLNLFIMYGVNGLISGEQDQETICPSNGCPDTARICWKNGGKLVTGFCQQCDPVSDTTCDHGWYHASCTVSTGCNTLTEFCTGGFCRKPNKVDVAISNIGGRNLEIYTNKTKVYGNADACAFYRLVWDSTGTDGTVVLSKGEHTFLRINFTPTVDGDIYRAYIPIYSNDTANNPLALYLCGRGAETPCSAENNKGLCTDESPLSKCGDFTDIMNTEAVCNDLK